MFKTAHKKRLHKEFLTFVTTITSRGRSVVPTLSFQYFIVMVYAIVMCVFGAVELLRKDLAKQARTIKKSKLEASDEIQQEVRV